MAWGPGKYDEALTLARKKSKATAALLIVLDGEHGPGFSVQGQLDTLVALPEILRMVAKEIEGTIRKGGNGGRQAGKESKRGDGDGGDCA